MTLTWSCGGSIFRATRSSLQVVEVDVEVEVLEVEVLEVVGLEVGGAVDPPPVEVSLVLVVPVVLVAGSGSWSEALPGQAASDSRARSYNQRAPGFAIAAIVPEPCAGKKPASACAPAPTARVRGACVFATSTGEQLPFELVEPSFPVWTASAVSGDGGLLFA